MTVKGTIPYKTLNHFSHLHIPGLFRNAQLKNHRWLLGKSKAPRRLGTVMFSEIYTSTFPACLNLEPLQVDPKVTNQSISEEYYSSLVLLQFTVHEVLFPHVLLLKRILHGF
jgi:hypothetical protein